MHSARDGFTFHGKIEDPAWTAGIPSSDSPAIGPDAIYLISFEILLSSTEKFFNAEDMFATAYLL